jgi:hypothetical protein
MKQLELWRFESTDAVASAVRLDLGVQKEVSKANVVFVPVLRSRIRDPGSGAFLTPGLGSGIRNRFFRNPDLGSRIPTPYFLELSDKYLGKKF